MGKAKTISVFLPSISTRLTPDAKLGTSFVQNQDQADRRRATPIVAKAKLPVDVGDVMFDRVLRDAKDCGDPGRGDRF